MTPTKYAALMGLKKLIGVGESGGNYNAYNAGTKNLKGGKVRFGGTYTGLTNMSINKILSMDNGDGNNPNRLRMIGKYQYQGGRNGTLASVVRSMGLTGQEKFTPELQERIHEHHMMKIMGIQDFIDGRQGLQTTQIIIAQQFRSVADPRTGKTYADSGAKANKASVSANEVKRYLLALKNRQ